MHSSSAAAEHHLALVLTCQAGYSGSSCTVYSSSRLNLAMLTHMSRDGQMPEPEESQCC